MSNAVGVGVLDDPLKNNQLKVGGNRLKKNKKIKMLLLKIAIILIAVVIIAYVIFEVGNLLLQPTDIVTVENGKISSEKSVEGYIIREETVLKGENYKNGMSQIKAEGEKISTGENAFRYYTKDEENLNNKIKELDNKIAEAQSQESNIFSSDVKVIETEIENKINQMNNVKDVQKIQEYKSELDELVKKKTKIIGELSPSGSYMKKLIQKRSEYEKQLNSGSEYMKAANSGVVSYKVDGLEETLNVNSLDNITEEYLNKLNLKAGQIVPSSTEYGKVVNNYYCYIATVFKKEDTEQLDEGKNIKVRLTNGDEITAKVFKIKEENNKNIVILKITKDVEELIEYRKINFDLIYWSYSGLKVPNSSIIKENDLNYVIRVRAGYKDKILVKVSKSNENYSIIEDYTIEELKEMGWSSSDIVNNKSIGIYDEVMVNPKE